MIGDPNDRSAPPVEGPGGVYCAPWCGFKCKRSAYDRAVIESAHLAETLGPGWTAHVWENCGWNYDAHKGSARVTPRKTGSTLAGTYSVHGYTAWLNFGHKQVIEHGNTPLEALAAGQRVMGEVIADLQNKLAEVEE